MKKGFIVYFDNCRLVETLPDDAYAAVFRTVTAYARRVAEGEEAASAEAWLAEQLAPMSADAAMAVRFMAENARRDHENYCARITQRSGKRTQGAGGFWQDSRNSAELRRIREQNLREKCF